MSEIKKSVEVIIWQGEQDKNVPKRCAEKIHERIPHSKVFYYPEDGHLSLVFKKYPNILKEMMK